MKTYICANCRRPSYTTAELITHKDKKCPYCVEGYLQKFAASDCNREAAQENLSTASIHAESEVVK